MKYGMYLVPAVIVIYWAIAFFVLHAQPTIHVLLALALVSFFVGYKYTHSHGHFLE